jgi:hypothetical protein
MANPPQPPARPSQPAQSAQPAKPQAPPQGPSSTEPHPPQKFKRPLPQPGDSDYVVGQPIDEEEATRVEREDEERYARGLAAVQEAQAKQASKDKPK